MYQQTQYDMIKKVWMCGCTEFGISMQVNRRFSEQNFDQKSSRARRKHSLTPPISVTAMRVAIVTGGSGWMGDAFPPARVHAARPVIACSKRSCAKLQAKLTDAY